MKIKIINIGSIASWSVRENTLLIKNDVEILIENSIILEIGESVQGADIEVDADGAFLTPGFVDSHTHPIFTGNRAVEFSMRLEGKSYDQIASKGGGILYSIQGVRNASEEQLFECCSEWIDYFLMHGTTTIEAKSGYGLSCKDEIKSLRVIKKLNQNSKLDIIPTFMGAHAIPPEYTNNPSGYIDIICKEMIPLVAEEGLAEYCDVFCEKGYFSIEESKKIFEVATKYNLRPRLHADEFVDSNAAELAADIGAISADHLMAVSNKGIKSMAKKGVIATLLPGTTLFLGQHNYASGRKIIDLGCEVALGTDFNPGSCTLQSMPIIISLSNLYCGLTIEEAFKASTYIGAKAINRGNKIGLISEGYQADIIFWSIESLDEIPYWMGCNRILKVMKKGELLEFN